MPGLVFFAEGVKKFMFPTEWGVGRFEKIKIIYPYFSAPFVGTVETVCGLLLIFDLFSRPAALLLLIDFSVAILTTKVPLALHKGFWPAVAEARADYSMFMSTLFFADRRRRGDVVGRLVNKKEKPLAEGSVKGWSCLQNLRLKSRFYSENDLDINFRLDA